ncbi:hypothetical protein Tco_0406874, partial [Tanacetum coccineum]
HHHELHSSPLHDLSDGMYRCGDAEADSFLAATDGGGGQPTMVREERGVNEN